MNIVYVKKDDDRIPVEVSKQSEIDNLVAVHGVENVTAHEGLAVDNDVAGVEPAVLPVEADGEQVFTSEDNVDV